VEQSLQISLLGRTEASWADGEAVDFKSKKALALLGYLAVEGKRAHTREHLATLLWGRTGEDRARHNLRQALGKIRACCGPLVVSSGDSLAIDLTRCSIDVVEFERLCVSDDLGQLRRCLDLYSGELLAGVFLREPVYEDWLIPARARLRQMACKVNDRLVERLVSSDRVEEAIETLDQRLQMDPACEPAHAQLMKLFVRCGRRSDAMRQYKVCVDAMQRELGARPGPELSALLKDIQQSESAVEPDMGQAPAVASLREEHLRGDRERPSVAVLPFANLSTDEDAYFVDGIVEDLITALSRFSSLTVSARGSSFRYRDPDVSDRQIAQELGAQYLVRGSLRRSGTRVRINVQLLDPRGEKNLWADRFDRELKDVFVVQDEITSTLVSILAGQVEAARLASVRNSAPERLDAYDILLRGKDHHHRFTPEDCRECIELFEHAVEKDPNYALAHTWLACGLGQAMVFNPDEIPQLLDRSEAAAKRGLELDENESECHRLLAQIFLTRRNLKRSLWHQERALFLNPNDDRSACSMGEILSFVGRHEEGEHWVRKSMALNPYHPQRYWTHLARPLFHQGRFREALGALDNVNRPRIDDHAYRIASLALLEDAKALARAVAEMRIDHPRFDAGQLAHSLTYEHRRDLLYVLDALASAGLNVQAARGGSGGA
jgi:TolB-like protein